MLQHVMQDWLDTDSYITREYGVCRMVCAAEESGVLNRRDTQMFHIVQWLYARGVSGTKSKTFPVAHPSQKHEAAFWSARCEGTMRTGEYGKNRVEFVEFVRDYAEEAWK